MFEIADRGTLLLDEIGDLPVRLQVKLLRVLQEQEVYRPATRGPLSLMSALSLLPTVTFWERVRERAFREDLFYRLSDQQQAV